MDISILLHEVIKRKIVQHIATLKIPKTTYRYYGFLTLILYLEGLGPGARGMKHRQPQKQSYCAYCLPLALEHTYVLSSQKVLSGSGRATRRWSMYFPIRRSLPARLEPDNTSWGDRAWDFRKKNRKKYWNRGDNKP